MSSKICLVVGLLLYLTIEQASTPMAVQTVQPLEPVRGSGCYRYGDNETPTIAKRAAMTLAQEDAVRGYRVFVQSASRVKNFQLEDDVIQTASAAMLVNVQLEKEEKKDQSICVTITAMLSPVSMEELIKQLVKARQIEQEAHAALAGKEPGPGAKLQVWTSQDKGELTEDERLVVHVRSARDGYLKLNYCQADGTVTRLVPNRHRGQAFIQAGKTYSFGDDDSPEQIVIGPPYGAEVIVAMTTSRLDEDPDETQDTVYCRDYLQKLQNGLKVRGAKLQAATATVSLHTASKAVKEYTKKRPKAADQAP